MAQLGQLLLERDWITEEQLAAALKRQRELGGRLGTSLLEIGALSEELLIKTLSEQLEVPVAGVEDLRSIPDDVRALLPAKIAIRHLAVPFRTGSAYVDVATLKVKDLEAIDELAFVLGKRMVVHIANEARIFEALDRYYGKECPVRMRGLLDRLNRNRDRWKNAPAPAARKPTTAPPRPAPRPTTAPAAAAARPSAPRPAPPRPKPVPETASAAAVAQKAAPPPPPRATTQPAAAATRPAAARRAGAPPAIKPQPRRSVALTSEERAALRGGAPQPRAEPQSRAEPQPRPRPEPAAEPAPRSGSRPRARSLSLEEMEARLESVRSTEEVGSTLLEFLSQEFIRTFLFRVQKDRVQGWMGRGPSLDEAAFHNYSVGFDEPSLFLNLQRGGDFFVGTLPRMPAHQRLVSCWGGDLAHSCALFPIRLRDHLVSVVYGDRDALGLDGLDLRLIQRVTAMATIAFEMCIMRKKLRRA